MTPKEHLIACFRALAATHGAEAIADKIEASSESLKQIMAGTKLPSGQPRGVGPNLQRKLDEHYPGWSKLPVPGGTVRVAASDVEAAINVLAASLSDAKPATRRAVGALLSSVADAPQDAREIAEQVQALLSVSGKHALAA